MIVYVYRAGLISVQYMINIQYQNMAALKFCLKKKKEEKWLLKWIGICD